MSDVRNFPGIRDPLKVRDQQPQDRVIVALKEALDAAENGKLQAVGIIGVYSDGSISTASSIEDHGHLYSLIAATSVLQHELSAEVAAGEEHEEDED